MNEAFHQLPEEKQLRIINAAIEVFANNDYKKASTDEIARLSGVSKGLLFYYFHNKKELYFYVFQYCEKLTKGNVLDEQFSQITDFFELLSYAANKKMELFSRYPYIVDFSVRAFYSEREEVSEPMKDQIQGQLENAWKHYFSNIDFSKFREDVDILQIYQMLIWMTDGYMNEKRRQRLPIVTEEIMKDFKGWTEMLRKLAYKEEYQI